MVLKSHRHHHRCHQGAIVDGSLGQKSLKTAIALYSDRCKAHYREYMTNQDAVDALDVVSEVVHMKTTLSLSFYLMGTPIGETPDHHCVGGKTVD